MASFVARSVPTGAFRVFGRTAASAQAVRSASVPIASHARRSVATAGMQVAMAPEIAAWTRPYEAGLLSKDELEAFYEEGFVLKRDVFDPAELEATKAAVAAAVDEIASALYAAGKIEDKAEEAGFYQRLTRLEARFPGTAVLLHKRGILPPAIAALWGDARLMSAARQMLGGDVSGHPVWNLRCKVPDNTEATVPWHQDVAYLSRDCWKSLQATAWIPLLDATLENGCMQVLRGGHRSGKVAKHTCCWADTWYVDLPLEEAAATLGVDPVADVVTCEVPEGSVLFLNNLVPHRSLNNHSDAIRWSLDLRWQRTGEPNGFWGLKDNIEMARAADPAFAPDWAAWAAVDRTVLQEAAATGGAAKAHAQAAEAAAAAAEAEADPFDTTIAGPWMGQWEMTHTNRHTASFVPAEEGGGLHGWHAA